MENSLSVLTFLFHQEWNVLKEAASQDPIYEVESFNSVAEILTYMSILSQGIIVSSINSKEDILKLAELTKKFKNVVTDGKFKFVAVNFNGKKEFDVALSRLGVVDLVSGTVNAKILRSKLEHWKKGLQTENKTTSNTVVSKTTAAPKETQTQSSTKNIQWVAPLSIDDDIWLVKDRYDCKQLMGKWLLKLMGPGPFVAQWNAVKGDKKLWRFDIKDEHKEYFLQTNETWYFRGDQRPEFVWQENLWMFNGKNVGLYITVNGEQEFRFLVEDKFLLITENSITARTKEQLILESFDKELLVKNEEKASGKDKTFEQDTHLQDLKGKSSTDHISQSYLTGGIHQSEGSKDNLQGSINRELKELYDDEVFSDESSVSTGNHFEGNNLTGVAGTDFLDRGPLTGKLSTKEQDKKNKIDDSTNSLEDQLYNQFFNEDFDSQELEDISLIHKNAFFFLNIWNETNEFKGVFVDYFDNFIVFRTTHSFVDLSLPVSLELGFDYLGEKTSLQFEGNIQAIEDTERDQYVTVELNSISEAELQKFMRHVSKRQKNINLFLKYAQGI
jgi:hypothetical protein